mgnify:FL=1
MKVGDLVLWSSGPGTRFPGALTAVKHFQRIKNRCGDKPGVILSVEGAYCKVMFLSDVLVVHKDFLEVINESR